MEASHNPFDMRKLEREINAIQTGKVQTMNESYTMLSTEVMFVSKCILLYVS